MRLAVSSSFLILLSGFAVQASANEKVLFSFDDSTVERPWQAVNDGVMGGRSDGRFRITDDKNLEFFGTLSLANNGGFASVRSIGKPLGLESGDTIVLRVRGDGRKYSLNLYPPGRRTAFSYRTNFATKPGEWIEVRLPFGQFEATSFGRVMRGVKLDPSQISGIGILLGDKRPGPFKLETSWIKVVRD